MTPRRKSTTGPRIGHGTAASRYRPGWLGWCTLFSLAGCATPAPQPVAPTAATRPNIVLIVVEDLGPRIGAYGDLLAVTPNIDRLAAEGIRFTRAFTTAGVCAPSRAALITGRYQHTIGAQHMRTSSFGRERSGPLGTFTTPGPAYETVPPPDVKAFPELLRRAGYFALNNRKTDYQFGEPFTVWDVLGSTATLRERDPGKPFFAMYSSNFTHESALFLPQYATALPGSAEAAERNARRLETLPERTDPRSVTVPGYLPDTPAVRREVARHYDNIRLMDRWVGDRIGELDSEGLLDETVVIWTTDHGDGFPRAKRSLYTSGTHVPLIIRFPDGFRSGDVDDRLVSFVDLAPTILGLAAAPSSDGLHGRDLFAAALPRRDYVHAGRDRLDEWNDRSRSVRDERFHYIRNYLPERPFFAPLYFRENLASMAELRRLRRAGKLPPALAAYFETPRPAEELYDTWHDPHELVNLAGDDNHANELRRLRGELDRWLTELGDWSETSEQEMVTGRMWPGGVQPATEPPRMVVHCDATSATGTTITLVSATPGASIGFRLAGDPDGRWRLYTDPISIAAGSRIDARAVRYGYLASDIASREPC